GGGAGGGGGVGGGGAGRGHGPPRGGGGGRARGGGGGGAQADAASPAPQPSTAGGGGGENESGAGGSGAAAADVGASGGAMVEATVPDIGGFSDVPVIEVLVAVGDTVAMDQGLVTLESDKATMEVPSSQAGVVRELKVKVGDTLSEGAVVALIETGAAPGSQKVAPGSRPPVA